MPVFFYFTQIFFGAINWDGEPDILRSVDHGGVNANGFPIQIYQRPAGVSGIYRGIGLDEPAEPLLVALNIGDGGKKPRKPRDNAGGNRVLKFSQGVADGDYRFAQFYIFGSPQSDYGESGGRIYYF